MVREVAGHTSGSASSLWGVPDWGVSEGEVSGVAPGAVPTQFFSVCKTGIGYGVAELPNMSRKSCESTWPRIFRVGTTSKVIGVLFRLV